MKITKFHIPLLFVIVLVFSACQKEYTLEEEPIPPVSISDSNYLDKIHYSYNVGGIKDTTRILSYIYDAQKRVIKIIDSSDVGPNFEILPERSYEYYYNGTDTIPFKSLYQKYSWANTTTAEIDSQTTFHYYDASLKRIKDSISDFTANNTNEWYVNRYSYTGNTITKIAETAPAVYQTTILQLDSRGNMAIGESDPDGVFTYEFDNKPSPFARLSNFRALQISLDIESAIYFYLIKNNNNILKNIDLSPSQAYYEIWDLNGDYVYRADGYPLKINNEYDPREFEIYEFKYRKL